MTPKAMKSCSNRGNRAQIERAFFGLVMKVCRRSKHPWDPRLTSHTGASSRVHTLSFVGKKWPSHVQAPSNTTLITQHNTLAEVATLWLLSAAVHGQ